MQKVHSGPQKISPKCKKIPKGSCYNDGTPSIFIPVLKDDSLHLKEDHDYFHQIQGQLHITGKLCCDLLVWTNMDLAIIRIARDDQWAPNLAKLSEFYFETFIPGVIE